jgi:transmembrane sensor
VTGPDDPDDIENQAAHWVIRRQEGPLAASDQAAFDAWLAQSPEHRRALVAAERAWAELGDLRAAPGALRADLTRTVLRAVPRQAPTPRRAWLGRRVASAVLAASLLLAIGIWWLGDPLTYLQADHRTGPGEIRTVMLQDGSAVALNAGSAIAIRFSAQERRVELLAGEALFTAAPMRGAEGRPFVVAAAGGTARALGTKFLIERNDGGVAVTVLEHRVEVATGAGTRILAPGQRLRYTAAGAFGVIASVNADRFAAWSRFQLTFDQAPLSQIVAELNRYRRGAIVIANADLAERRVSGVFRLDDLDGALALIAQELSARTVSMPPFVTILY